jgi:hypothetical protein
VKPGDKGLTRPRASARVSAHKNEVRSIARGYFQNQFRVPAYKHVGRPTQDSQKRDESLDKVTNVIMEQYTLPTDTNELPNLPTRIDVETWWLTNDETITLRSENGWSIDLQSHTVTQPHMMMTTLLWCLMTRPTRHITVFAIQC